jgi:hypothetical protein
LILKGTDMKSHKNIFLRALVISSVMMLTSLSSAHASKMNYISWWLALNTSPAGSVVLQGPIGLKGDTGPVGPEGPAGSGSFTYSNTCGVSGTDPCKIGAVGPGGGWIFFVDKDDQYPGFTYLEAAPTDIAAITWCSDTTNSIPAVSEWAAKGVGKGQANTTAMLGVCTSGAANAADQYLTATESDWFLPSLGEAKLMYDNLLEAGVGGFNEGGYWSSSELTSNFAWLQVFYYGYQNYNDKYGTFRVRAVRVF